MGFVLFIRSRIYSSFRGPRKSLIFGESPRGTPKSSARMGRAEALVAPTAAEQRFFATLVLKARGALISIHRNPLAKSLLTRGILRSPFRRSLLMSAIRLGLCRVVGLLQRAEEGCEGLKHGYYDLPCVHFLILCHNDEIRWIHNFASPPSRLQNHRR